MNPWVSRLGVGGGSLEHRPDSEVARDRHDYEGDGRGGDWAAAMFSDSSSPVNWVGKSPGGAIHVS